MKSPYIIFFHLISYKQFKTTQESEFYISLVPLYSLWVAQTLMLHIWDYLCLKAD
jgi:hypothetical protein